MPFPSCPNLLDKENRLTPLTTALCTFDSYHRLSLRDSLLQIKLTKPFSILILCFGVAMVPPQAGVTHNHSLFHWTEEGQTPEGLHAGQPSFLTVVIYNLFLVKLSGHIISKLQYFSLKIIPLFWNCLFLANPRWLSLTARVVLRFIYILHYHQFHPMT